MVAKIIKRDGREVPFNIEKIANAIFKAAKAIGGSDYDGALNLAYKVTEEIEKDFEKTKKLPTVEQIQDTVEKVLMKTGHSRTAKEYILYRAERNKIREMNTRLMKTYEDITFKSAKESNGKRENANIDGDTAMGTMLEYGSAGAKQFCEMFILDPKHSKAHHDGDIHIHDMEFYSFTTTCCQIDIDRLFTEGFYTDIRSGVNYGYLREPSNIASYSALACIAIQSNQNDQHGGQSIPNFDYAMAKGVEKTYIKLYKSNLIKYLEMGFDSTTAKNKKIADIIDESIKNIKEKHNTEPVFETKNDYGKYEKEELAKYFDAGIIKSAQRFAGKYAAKETDRATFQAMEALVHNLNTMHSRAGAQVPFSSLNYGLDTSPAGRLVIKNILLALEAGLGDGETPIFPIHIFKLKEGKNYNKEDKNYDLFKLAVKVSAKRLYPNFSFIDAPYNLKYYKEGQPETEVAYMGCRTRVIANYFDDSKETTFGRGNLSFTSLNLPRLAIKAKGDIEKFYSDLEEKIDIIIAQLLHRFKIQSGKKIRNFPFLMGQGIWLDSEKLKPDDEIGEVLKHGTLTMGFIGLAECLTALCGRHHGESEEAQTMGLEIVGFMRKKMDEATVKYGLNFTLIATPAEGLSGRFVKIDKELFGEIKNITDRDFYTNSFHIPVYYNISAHKKIELEAPYHPLTNAGHITYIEMDGNPSDNLEAFEEIIRHMKECGVGYGSINHPVDRDPVCGFMGIINDVCPKCGRSEDDGQGDFTRIRRVTGYLGTLDRFNDAKLKEEKARVKHYSSVNFSDIEII
ncbi:MAG: anaerobic ribonucleoside triphosphate reductase [Oscillospiraceae bacterium]|nr:anaerobic ribonucleoside triphosphate reductase [Oscillospiraceae bacterium]